MKLKWIPTRLELVDEGEDLLGLVEEENPGEFYAYYYDHRGVKLEIENRGRRIDSDCFSSFVAAKNAVVKKVREMQTEIEADD